MTGNFNFYMLMSIAAYMVVVIVIGFVFARRNDQIGDFYLGGRKLGTIVTAMSAEASDMSSWLLMGLPGVAYLSGIADAGWTAIGLAIGTYVNWLTVARRLRCYSQLSQNAITLPEFFSNRYRDSKKILTWIASIVILIFFIPYTAAGFASCGKLFNSVFGLDYTTAMLIGAVVVVAYTTVGGFLAASTTDLIQGIVMSIALLSILMFGAAVAGGIDAVWQKADAIPGYLSMMFSHNSTTGQTERYGLITIISTMAWELGYFGMPHILLRFMAIRDEKKIVFSRQIAVTWVVVSLAVAVLIGIVGQTLSLNGEIAALEGSASETIIIRMAQLLVASSSVTENLIKECFGIRLSEKTGMMIARSAVIVIAAIAAFIARDPDSSIFVIISFAWAGFGAAFGPVMLFALFWRRSNVYGAIAGMVSGGVMVFVWKYLVRPLGGVWNIYELLPAFVFACLAIIVVSLLSKAPAREITDEFDAVVKMGNRK